MKICKYCGQKLKSYYNFCPHCGTKTDQFRSALEEPPMRECNVWFMCPKCGMSFERYGYDINAIKFGTCTNCGYQED